MTPEHLNALLHQIPNDEVRNALRIEIAALEERCLNLQLQRNNELAECQTEMISVSDLRLNERLSYLQRVGEQEKRIAELTNERDQAKHAFNTLQHEFTEAQRIHNQEQNRDSAAKDTELERLRALYASLRDLLPSIAQILDGWHQDGTAWSEWDESIRKQLTELHLKYFGKEAEEALKEPK